MIKSDHAFQAFKRMQAGPLLLVDNYRQTEYIGDQTLGFKDGGGGSQTYSPRRPTPMHRLSGGDTGCNGHHGQL